MNDLPDCAYDGCRGCSMCMKPVQPSRWNRNREDVLEARIKELESQLEQARKSTDLETFRDMLARNGFSFDLYSSGGYTFVELSNVVFVFRSSEHGRLFEINES